MDQKWKVELPWKRGSPLELPDAVATDFEEDVDPVQEDDDKLFGPRLSWCSVASPPKDLPDSDEQGGSQSSYIIGLIILIILLVIETVKGRRCKQSQMKHIVKR